MKTTKTGHIKDTTEKQFPCDLNTEKAVLAAILLENEAHTIAHQAFNALKVDDFFFQSHKDIFRAMEILYKDKQAIDLITLQHQLSIANKLEEIGGMAYIASLLDGAVKTTSLNSYISTLHKQKANRDVLYNTVSIQAIASEGKDPRELKHYLESSLHTINAIEETSPITDLSDILRDCIDKAEANAQKVGLVGMPTGLTLLDKHTCGIHKQHLVIIGALSSAGKTALALNIGKAASVGGYSVGVISLEMGRNDLATRLLCNAAEIDGYKFRTGWFTSEECKRLIEAQQALVDCPYPMMIERPQDPTMAQIRLMALRMKAKQGLDLLVIDYIQLIRSERGSNASRAEKVAEIAQELKALSIELDIAIITPSQFSREYEREMKIRQPELRDLLDSSGIGNAADEVFLLHNHNDENNPTYRELIIRKQRSGIKDIDFKVEFVARYTKFQDIPTT